VVRLSWADGVIVFVDRGLPSQLRWDVGPRDVRPVNTPVFDPFGQVFNSSGGPLRSAFEGNSDAR
jgi:hypothetical protein